MCDPFDPSTGDTWQHGAKIVLLFLCKSERDFGLDVKSVCARASHYSETLQHRQQGI